MPLAEVRYWSKPARGSKTPVTEFAASIIGSAKKGVVVVGSVESSAGSVQAKGEAMREFELD
jgi:hypothetical protein